MGSIGPVENPCWVTLITKPSYLPGALILSHSMDKQGSRYPFIIQYTDTLGDEALDVLKAEAKRAGRIVPMHVDLLLPRKGQENTGSVAARFADTFSKLRAFELYKLGYTKVCFLDADMAVFNNPDTIFDINLPGRDWLAACQSCVCNPDQDKWAPKSWHKGNCSFTSLTGPDQVAGRVNADDRPTFRSLNGGTFLFHPTEQLWKEMLDYFNTTDNLKSYQFPDQDFLAEFFSGKWIPMSWKYNALKTMRYLHPTIWDDKKVVVVHYIVDKPWERKVSPDGIAGHLGRDGFLHQKWWALYDEWVNLHPALDPASMKIVGKLVNQNEPFTKSVPLPQAPGKPADFLPYP